MGARIRFSPSGASVRSQAIERIIEQNLASTEIPDGLTEQQLQNMVTLGGQLHILRASDIRQGLIFLKQSDRVREIKDGTKLRYTLSPAAKKEVDQLITETEKITKATIHELFENASGGEEAYGRAFLILLCKVFSTLSQNYVQIITKNQEGADFAGHKMLAVVMDEVLRSEQVPDDNAFRYGVNCFFRESTPRFDHIKWNMTQNYYVAKALGIDPSSNLLSSEIFKDAVLYCDTNILIAALTPENRHHNSFRELANCCKALGMCLKATHATLTELQWVINFHTSTIRKVLDRIPEETRPKVRNFLLEAYLIEKETSPDITLDAFLRHFEMPLQSLRESFGVIEEDDAWFVKSTEDPDTKSLAKSISRQYEEMRGRPKSEYAALHDAQLLLWLVRENIANRKSWVVTLDVTLAAWNARERMEGSKVITLDAFLQWMTPVVSGSADENKLAEIFSYALKYLILPRDVFFRLSDFLIFEEIGIETKQLPADDVEACIREIRKAGPQLDPSKAEDREKIGQVIQRYFADPGTKYKRKIDELQAHSDSLVKELTEEKRVRADTEKRAEEQKKRSQEMSEQLENDKKALAEASLRIEKLEKSMKEKESAVRLSRLKNSVIGRTIMAFGILVVIEAIIGYLIWLHGEGPNLFQKLTKAWPWLGAGFAVVVILYPFLMGRERMRLIKRWKGETD
jgi:hypothetical protein